MSLQRHLVHGTVVQQAGQAVGLVSSLAMATALGRSLTLPEFGVFGLVVSFSTYLFFALGSAETAAVRAIAAAGDDPRALDRAVTIAVTVYVAFGAAAGLLLAGGGLALLPLFDLDPALNDQARLGVVALAVTTAVGFPLRLFQDLLRATQRFALAGLAEALGYSALAGAVLVCLYVLDTDLWILIGVGGALPLWLGLAAALVSAGARVTLRVRPSLLDRAGLSDFVRIAGGMAFVAASDVVITSLDRAVLAAFRSAATVGLYEGAARLNALVRAFVGSLSITLLPVLAAMTAGGQRDHERALLLRGTRYMLAAVVPPVVTGMVLCDLLLASWLGEEFAAAGPAAAILLAWWLLAPGSSIANSMFVVDGRIRKLAGYSWAIAAINLALSLALTPVLGLEGVVIGTTVAYASVFPVFMRYALVRQEVPFAEFARVAWLPAYGAGAIMAAGLGVVRLVVDLDGAAVFGVAAAATAIGYLLVYAGFFDADERAMLRSMVRRAR